MILKELDPFDGRSQEDLDARIPADRVVYHLRRHFRHSTEVDVLHELRLRCGRSLARIDHLLLYEQGLVVVQRFDTVGHLVVNGDGQWSRLAPGPSTQTPESVPLSSPVTHAYIQALLLKDFLDRHVRQPGYFDHLRLDVLVVLHDDSEVRWPSEGMMEEVCRRDQVFERVSRCMAQMPDPRAAACMLGPRERRTMGQFLIRSHRPASRD